MGIHEGIGKSDEWYTPKYVFDAMETRFDLDVSAPQKSCPANLFCETSFTDGALEKEWFGFVWMNPPFGGRNGTVPWLKKLAEHGNGVALVPDSTSAKWWQEAAKASAGVLFTNGRVKFIDENGNVGNSPANGTSLMAFGWMAAHALQTAEMNGLGIFFPYGAENDRA